MLFPILREQLLFLRSCGFDIHTASIAGPLGQRIREDGFSWTGVPFTREIAPLQDWRAAKFITALCQQHRFTIVHTHTPKANVVGQWAARRAGVPIVLQTLHGFYFHERMSALKRRIWIRIERFSARQSDHVLCQNPEDVATAERERIVEPGRITLLGNGIDVQRFAPAGPDDVRRSRVRNELKIPPDAVVVGMVGRLVAEKGYPEFFGALAQLLPRLPKLHALVVAHRQSSERSAQSFTIPQSPVFSGRVHVLENRDDMPDLYAAMDVNVLPSHREGFPRVLLEGAATALPQVATHIRGCRQAVVDGQTGFLIEVGASDELARRIEQLAADRDLRKRLGTAARQKAEAEFDQRFVFEKVRVCYERLLQQKSPAR